MGLGQAYNRQLVKSLLFLAIFVIMIFIGQHKQDSEYIMWAAFGIYIFFIIDAARGTKKAARTAIIGSRMKEVEKKAKAIFQYKEMNHEFAVDTNILMHVSAGKERFPFIYEHGGVF